VNDSRLRFSTVITVTPDDIDELGHVNNTVYLRYMEDIARAHAASLGVGVRVMLELGCVPVARQHLIKYHRAAMPGDTLEVSTRITSAAGLRATRHYEIRRTGSEDLLVEAETEWVWVNPATGRPRPVVPEILRAFGLPEPAR